MEEEDELKEDRKRWRERRRRYSKIHVERKILNMNGLERYAILSTGTAVCVPDN